MSGTESRFACLRPDYETATHWGQWHFKDKVLSLADALRISYEDLYGINDYKGYFNEVMKHVDVKFLDGIGHGNTWLIVGHNGQIILDSQNSGDLELMKGKHGSFLSCEFGASAKTWVEAGMLSFFGYKVTYYFVVSTFPDSYAEPFFKSHMVYDQEMLQGTQPTRAFQKCGDAYDREILQQPDWIARYLINDRDGMTLEYSEDRSPFAPEPQKLKCPWSDFEATDNEELKNHIVAVHCSPCPPWPAPCWLWKWLRDLLDCKL